MSNASEFIHPLRSVSLKVIEDWGMMFADEIPSNEAEFDPKMPLYMSWVDVKGVIDGALSIVAQKNFLSTLARNVLGLDDDEELTEEDMKDAFCEMGNILAGNFFTEAFGNEVVFDIIKPEVNIVDYSELQKIKERRVKFFFIADESSVAVTFSVKG